MVAVSGAMRADILDCYPALDPARVHVVHNGIDTALYRPDHGTDALARIGVDPNRPYVLFVGRITRQKGVPHLLRAARHLDPATQVVLCAGAPDTPEIDREFRELFEELSRTRDGVHWIPRMLPRPEVIQLLTHATVFVCPSVYEPLGIVNLEAMACGTPVVASGSAASPRSSRTAARDCSSTSTTPGRPSRRPSPGAGRGDRRPGARPADGRGGPRAGGGRVRLGRRGTAHRRAVRGGPEGVVGALGPPVCVSQA